MLAIDVQELRGRGTLSLRNLDDGLAEIAKLNGNVEEGIITHPSTGKRLSTTGPNEIQPVLDELEKELGEEIPRMVVEAQRRYVREEGFLPDQALKSEEVLRLTSSLTCVTMSLEASRSCFAIAFLPSLGGFPWEEGYLIGLVLVQTETQLLIRYHEGDQQGIVVEGVLLSTKSRHLIPAKPQHAIL
ncbi:MAG: hypothetical protein H5T72_10760 [Actinobacteria bacterium]|nr:hypothetical protein [Actinomycetota bacterium]